MINTYKLQNEILECLQREGIKFSDDRNKMYVWAGYCPDSMGCYIPNNIRYGDEQHTIFLFYERDNIRFIAGLFHEAAHAVRMNHYGVVYNGSSLLYSIEECIAEITSVLMMRHFQVNNALNRSTSSRYIKGYAKAMPFGEFRRCYKIALGVKEFLLRYWFSDIGYKSYKEAA